MSIVSNLELKGKHRIKNLKDMDSSTAKPKTSHKLFSLFQRRQDSDSYATCFHYYKRSLTPLFEGARVLNEKTPYLRNFETFKGRLISTNFRKEMVAGLEAHGATVKCVTAQDNLNRSKPDRVLQTFMAIETKRKKIVSRSVPVIAPASISTTGEDPKSVPAWIARLRKKQIGSRRGSIEEPAKEESMPELPPAKGLLRLQKDVVVRSSRVKLAKPDASSHEKDIERY